MEFDLKLKKFQLKIKSVPVFIELRDWPGVGCGVSGVGQSSHACGVGDLKSRPAVVSRQRTGGVVHVVVWKIKRSTNHICQKSSILTFNISFSAHNMSRSYLCWRCGGGSGWGTGRIGGSSGWSSARSTSRRSGLLGCWTGGGCCWGRWDSGLGGTILQLWKTDTAKSNSAPPNPLQLQLPFSSRYSV